MVESILHVLLTAYAFRADWPRIKSSSFLLLFVHLNYNDIFLTKKVECDFQVINKTDVFFEVRIS